MIFEALEARFGDCLLLRIPDGARDRLVLVDGGPDNTLPRALRDRLKALGMPGTSTVILDSLVVSHIDADHITGVIDLLEEVKSAKQANGQPPFRVSSLVFNSFDLLVSKKPKDKPITSKGAAGEVLASVPQGNALSALARALDIPANVNANPPGSIYLVGKDSRPRFKVGPATFTVLGPNHEQVEKLQVLWAEWQAKQDSKSKAALVSYEPPRVCRRLQLLRRWSHHEQDDEQVFA